MKQINKLWTYKWFSDFTSGDFFKTMTLTGHCDCNRAVFNTTCWARNKSQMHNVYSLKLHLPIKLKGISPAINSKSSSSSSSSSSEKCFLMLFTHQLVWTLWSQIKTRYPLPPPSSSPFPPFMLFWQHFDSWTWRQPVVQSDSSPCRYQPRNGFFSPGTFSPLNQACVCEGCWGPMLGMVVVGVRGGHLWAICGSWPLILRNPLQ